MYHITTSSVHITNCWYMVDTHATITALSKVQELPINNAARSTYYAVQQ